MLHAVRFRRGSFLTPGEQDVLRRFCAGLGRLPARPSKIAVFGSRARGASHAHSDLDVAVLVEPGDATPELDAALAKLAMSADSPYREKGYGIFLKPVAVETGRDGRFHDSIQKDFDIVWTRPRSPTK